MNVFQHIAYDRVIAGSNTRNRFNDLNPVRQRLRNFNAILMVFVQLDEVLVQLSLKLKISLQFSLYGSEDTFKLPFHTTFGMLPPGTE